MDITNLRSIPGQAQLQASFVRSIGNAILETQLSNDHGHGLEQLHVPSIMDVLDVRYVFTGKLAEADAAFAHDPAEIGSVDIAPTIANAIHDAVGVRIHSLPLSAEKILAALREKDAVASSFASAPTNIHKRGMQWNA